MEIIAFLSQQIVELQLLGRIFLNLEKIIFLKVKFYSNGK